MPYKTVIYEVKDKIARIIMNRPEKRNALNHQLLADLDAAFEAADTDPEVSVVILSGAGSAFSAGYDIAGSPYTTVPEGYDQWTTANALRTMRGISARYLRIMDLTKPVIAQVHGYCLAAGCYLQMCCDIGIASENAVLGHPVSRGSGGVTSMPLWVTYLGLRKAKELLFTSRLIDGKEAERIGLVNRAVPEEKLEEEVWNTAKTMADVQPDSLLMLKEALNTHADIMGRAAVFAYHRQLNAMHRVRRKRDEPFLNLESLRARTRGQQKS